MSFSRFLKNLRYLWRVKLKDEEWEAPYRTMQRMDDYFRYEVMDSEDYFNSLPYLKVLDNEETVALLKKAPKSFCRFGDGELEIILGKGIAFQSYDDRLAEQLRKILATPSSDYYVGIHYACFHSARDMNDNSREFYFRSAKKYRDVLWSICDRGRTYIGTGFSQAYVCMGGTIRSPHTLMRSSLYLRERMSSYFAATGFSIT